MKIMLDTNIIVSAFVFKSTIIRKVLNYLSKYHEIYICSYTLYELKRLIREKFKVPEEELTMFLNDFPIIIVNSPQGVRRKFFSIRDPNDYIILHSAIIHNMDIFITGDKDFDDVKIDKPIIMNISQFYEKFIK